MPRGTSTTPPPSIVRRQEGIGPEENANVLIWQCSVRIRRVVRCRQSTLRGSASHRRRSRVSPFKATTCTSSTTSPECASNAPVPASADQKLRKRWDERVSLAKKWPWKSAEQPDVADWLKKNDEPLAIAIEASKANEVLQSTRLEFERPASGSAVGLVAPQRANVSRHCQRPVLPCHVACGQWRPRCARQDLMACQRLGRLVAQKGTTIEGLVGSALVAIATNGQIALLGSCTPTPKQLAAWSDELRQLPPMTPLADKFDQVERFVTLDSLSSIIATGSVQLSSIGGSNGGNPDKPIFWERLFSAGIEWDPAFRNVNKMYDECSAASRLSDRAVRQTGVQTDQRRRRGRQCRCPKLGPLGQDESE